MNGSSPTSMLLEWAHQFEELESLRKWQQTRERYDRVARRAAQVDALTRHEFRLFCHYLFPGDRLREHRKKALKTGQVAMTDGRVIRRKDHQDR